MKQRRLNEDYLYMVDESQGVLVGVQVLVLVHGVEGLTTPNGVVLTVLNTVTGTSTVLVSVTGLYWTMVYVSGKVEVLVNVSISVSKTVVKSVVELVTSETVGTVIVVV